MSGVERAAAVIEEHRFDKGRAACRCGRELSGTGHRERAWRSHVAEALDAAGLLAADPP